MKHRIIAISALLCVPFLCVAANYYNVLLTLPVTPPQAVVVEDVLRFSFEYPNHPTSVTINASYIAPADTNAALYDSGDGVWRSYTSRTIPVVAGNKYVSFKGDWRKSGGVYSYMFSSAFTATNARCRTSGRFAYAPTNNASAYREVFNSCTQITSFDDNPLQLITGAPAASMFQNAFATMSGLTNLPAGFMNTSGLTGAPAANVFYRSCYSMSGVTNLPANFMNTSGLTGAPAGSMFYQSCNGMSGVTNLPADFLNMSGLTGAPAASMLYQTCQNMSGVTAGDFNMSSNITFATTNIASSMTNAFAGMTKWTGTVYWGTNRIYDAITNPATSAKVFLNSTNVPGYATMGANWK
jgi:hypothetical protein